MTRNQEGYSLSFYALATVGVAGVVGGLYYIYSIFNEEEETSEITQSKIEDLQQDLETNLSENMNNLTLDQAVRIISLMNKMTEEIVKKKKPDLDERRRAAINNEALYQELVGESLEERESAMMNAQEVISKKFNGINMEDIAKIMQSANPETVERLVLLSDKPQFEGTIPSKEKVKEIFTYYGNNMLFRMRDSQMAMNQGSMDPNQQQYIFFKILMSKMKVDDELFVKYRLTENQLKYLFYEYKLENDSEVKSLYDKCNRFSEMMG